jgi:hypothetical protein
MDMGQGIDRVMATHIPARVRDHARATYIPAGGPVLDVLSADTPAAADQAVGQAAEITVTENSR